MPDEQLQDQITFTLDKPDDVAFVRAQYQRYGAASEAEFLHSCVQVAREDCGRPKSAG